MDPLMAPVIKKMIEITNLDEIITADEEEIEQQVAKASPRKKTRVVPANTEPIARRHQLKILEQALEKNTLVYLETGCGKTLITVLLMKEMGNQMREQKKRGEKGIIIFLAVTVQFAIQQYESISINTDMRVEEYYRAKGVDGWTAQAWNEEIKKHEVLVMTPQILLDVLTHGFVKLEMVKLIIFDEFYHTMGNHPYAKIMKEYYQTSQTKPKIFGMTTSPVIRKGVSSSHNCMDQIAQLERILDSQVYALEERSELELFVPTPKHKTIYYSPSVYNQDALKLDLTTLREKYETLRECKGKNLQSQFEDYVGFIEKLKKEIRSIHGNIEYCLENLGLFCALKAVEAFIDRCKTRNNLEQEAEDLDSIQSSKNGFLEEALQILKCWLLNGMEKCFSMHEDNQTAVKEGHLTPKVYILVQYLLSYRKSKEIHCIIFVEKVIAAVVISSLINELDILSNIRSEYLAGRTGVFKMCQKKQQSTFDLFSAGKVNVLVTTNVTEEGLNVQSCSCIIQFDSPNTVCSYIQSHVQAHNPKSDYVALVERNNEMQVKMFDVMSEESMIDTSLYRNQNIYTPKSGINDDEKIIPYNVLSTGAAVTCDSSIDLIYRYCAKLQRDKYYLPQPEFVFEVLEGKDNLHICILRLPPNAFFQEVVSPPSGNLYLAKQLACLEACKKLHEVGALEQHLLPINEANPEEEIVNLKYKITTGAGTTKRKELHITSKAKALSGYWGEELNGITLQVYKLVFTSQDDDNGTYSKFILLIEEKLDNDVANAEIDLHLKGGRVVRSRFMPCGELHLNSIQISDAKAFHEILFNGIFNRLALQTKETNESVIAKRNISGTKITEGIWSSSNMYFLLPLEPEKSGVCHNGVNIDWKSIHQCADVARYLKGNNTAGLQVGENGTRNIHLATGPILNSDLLEKAVLTLHTGKIYCVTNILNDKTAESPFPDTKKYNSYSDYFEKKYGMKLNFLKQPLLQVKQSHRPHNLLARYGVKSKGKEFDLIVEPTYIELPPEICLNLGVSSSVICSLYLLPSVMHRMNTLMLANQLREEIQECSNCPFIPSTLIMQGLTTTRCMESFSFDQLELLGDSVLKYAVSCHLFLKYDKKNEGQLCAYRSLAVCNATLHALATSHNLPGYIRDEPFDPSRWVAPGTYCKRIVPCCCDAKKIEESVEGIVDMEDKVVKIGKTCDKGHRWLCSKTIADFVEALIGSYLVGGGLTAALKFMNWMNIPVAYEPGLVSLALEHAFVHPNILRRINIHAVESLLGYVFQHKALLVEAITHATQEDSEGGCCYQRLEFLGDAVLDFLITRHLYEAHPDLPTGILTDLRSAAVNNKHFAYVAVKHCLQRYLRHGSGVLLEQITGFARAVQQCKETKGYPLLIQGGVTAPKVLGDLVESIAGAILVDSRFNVEKVWEVMKPFLSPIVTPETLNLNPIREAFELCHLKGYPMEWKKNAHQGKLSVVTVEVALEDSSIVGKGCSTSKKSAREEAAQQILMQMKQRGIHHPRCCNLTTTEAADTDIGGTTKQNLEEIISPRGNETTYNRESEASEILELERKKTRVIDTPVNFLTSQDPTGDEKALGADMQRTREQSAKEVISPTKIVDIWKIKPSQTQEFPGNKEKIIETPMNSKTSQDPIRDKQEDTVSHDAFGSYDKGWCPQICIALCMQKGGPRTNLYDFCKNMKWCKPIFQLVEEGLPHTERFMFRVVLYIPEKGGLTIKGEERSDKKSAMDSAALSMLLELNKQGFCSLKRKSCVPQFKLDNLAMH